MRLENIMWGLVTLLIILGVSMAFLSIADWVMNLAIRVFPRLGKFLESLPLWNQ